MKLFILAFLIVSATGAYAQTPSKGAVGEKAQAVKVSETVRLRAENAALKAQLLYAQSKEMEAAYTAAQQKLQADFNAAQAVLKDAIKDASTEAKMEVTFDLASESFVPKPEPKATEAEK
jgi:hypothetical protein